MPNPYAGVPLRPWERARMGADEVRQYEREARDRRLLARVWLTAWRRGLDAYAAERGLARLRDLQVDDSA
ncbi:hypothetical protein MOQ72_39265 [Saccharopolyspora sp. K220]|uniref:hypothetical protein n=1 Tax=Saccharopolyspora soli TaxID=2926618 RepID=UPI001F5A6142|nr:hypothetical protein [Saccharopolyspora soli]MCI2423469.1 hypothetical protein [Saccharopolyspora soli]